METFPESTSQGNPSNGNPSYFPSFVNTSAPYMVTLSLSGLTISLLVWLFLASVILSVQTTFHSISLPHEQHQPHVDPKVDPSPSSPISSSGSSSSSNESMDSSN